MNGDWNRIDPEETVYRRIPASQNWYVPSANPPCLPPAFRPTDRDITGISLSRSKLKSPEEAAAGQPGKNYYLAELRVKDILHLGLDVVCDNEDDPSHVVIPSIKVATKRDQKVIEDMRRLAELPFRFHGVFPTPKR